MSLPVSPGAPRFRVLAFLFYTVAILAVPLFYVWTVKSAAADLRFRGGERADYYNLLLDGFQEGHLYTKMAVDPALLALPPDQRPGNAPFKLDASLYHDHYYLYFGVVPVVTLFWPYHLVTGQDIPEAGAALVFAIVAFLFSTWWWLDVRRRFLPKLGAGWVFLGILAIGFCTALPSTLRRPMFYEVAIAAGWAYGAIALWALTRAYISERRTIVWLAVAGLATGLAIGSRANLALGGIVAVALGCVGIAVSRADDVRARVRRAWTYLLAAGVTMGAVGAGLAAYNYARFGSVTEFGHTYQIGVKPEKLFRLTNLTRNVYLYYFAPPRVNGYFPYVAPAEEGPKPVDYVGREHAHGEWLWMVVVVIVVGLLVALRRSRPATVPRGLLWAPVAWFAINLLVTCLAGVRANRYMVDFHPDLVVVTVIALGFAVAGLQSARLTARLKWLAALGIILAVMFNILASMQAQGFFPATDPSEYRALAARFDGAVGRVLKAEFADVGDRVITVRWPEQAARGIRQPLLTAGSVGFDDTVYVECDGNEARLAYAHGETADAVGPWFPIVAGETSEIHLSGALLLPGVDHPWYGSRPMAERLRMKRELRIWVDDRVRFVRDVPSYDSSPGLQHWGRHGLLAGGREEFTGEILKIDDQPFRPFERDPSREAGTLRLQLRLPVERFGLIEPLMQTGDFRKFDILGVQYTRPGFVRLAHDQLGGGARWSEEFPVDYNGVQSVEIEVPAPRTSPTTVGSRVRVLWNGQLVFAPDLPFVPAPAETLTVGMSDVQGMCSRGLFSGLLAFAAPPKMIALSTPGELGTKLDPETQLAGPGGSLISWRTPSGHAGSVMWRRTEAGNEIEFGWSEGGTVTWSKPVPAVGMLPFGMKVRAVKSGERDGWIELLEGRKLLLAARTEFFVEPLSEAEVLGSSTWSQAKANEVAGIVGPDLPGRIRIRFGLPAAGFAGSDPLFSAGHVGAADSIYLRSVGGGRYRLGIDHWGVGGAESEPFALATDKLHALVIELGPLFPDGKFEKDRLRATIDGRVVLESRMPFYAVKPEEIVIGRNPLGMSTSGTEFRGDIVSVETRVEE